MVITPDECLKLTVDEDNEVLALEKEIDKILREKYDSHNATVEVSIKHKGSARVLRKVLEDYKIAGWEICLLSASAGASSYKFSKIKIPPTFSGGYYDR